MSKNLYISISRKMSYYGSGIPDGETYRVEAVFESLDEMSHLGSIEFENADDLVALRDALDSYIDEYALEDPLADGVCRPEAPEKAPEKGGEA